MSYSCIYVMRYLNVFADRQEVSQRQSAASDGRGQKSNDAPERPEGRRLFDLLRAGDTLVVRWVDRLGRNYADVCDAIREFLRRGVVVRTVINSMVFDGATRDPMQQAVRDALIAFMAATAHRRKPRRPERRRRLESPMPRLLAMDATKVANRATPATNSRLSDTCCRKRRGLASSPKRPD